MPFRGLPQDHDVFPIDPAELAHRLQESSRVAIIRLRPRDVSLRDVGQDVRDLWRFPHLLRLCGERRKNEGLSENDEPDQPHGHLGGGWLAGVYQNKTDLNYWRCAGSSVRLMTAPHDVIHARFASTPLSDPRSSWPQYSCSRMKGWCRACHRGSSDVDGDGQPLTREVINHEVENRH